MSTNTEVRRNSIAPTNTDSPRTAIRDAVLADASANVDGPDVIDGLLWLVERDCATATITGAGPMVGFHEFNGVTIQ